MANAIQRRHSDLRRLRECRLREGKRDLFEREMADLFADRSVDLRDFHVRPLFEAMVDDGHELVQNHYAPNMSGGYQVQEASDAVQTSMFPNIMGQYLFNAILRAYESPEFIGDRLVSKMSTMLSGEKIPGISPIGDVVEVVNEGQPYPNAVFGENWIETPETIKRGLIVDVTKEAIFFDKTGLILIRAAEVGNAVGLNREKRILDVVFGLVSVYKRNGGAVEATYQSDNTVTTTPLTDYTSLDAADNKFAAMTDPDTGEPIVLTPNLLVVPTALRNTANRIKSAFMTNVTASARETRVGSNSLNYNWDILTSPYVKQRTSSDTTWFYGDFPGAFVYSENWPMRVEQENASSAQAFDRDIVQRYKASERGAAGAMERKKVLKGTA